MNTIETNKEQISALVDGELAEEQIDLALAALRRSDRRSDWDMYHQIGDVLRSDDMAVTLSAGFAASMAARLEAEPTIIAPALADRSASQPAERQMHKKRWVMPMAAAAAVAAVAFVTVPQLMVAVKGGPMTADALGGAAQPTVVAAQVPEGVVMRDARIDDYLLAHQRFSPSVYSTAQYARSATFATDLTK